MRLIDADALKHYATGGVTSVGILYLVEIDAAPTIDAVEVNDIEAWLYEIAMNNTDNYFGNACEEIISRLDGLRMFAKEGKQHDLSKMQNRNG